MYERQLDVLRLQPHAIPTLRATLGTALDQLDRALGQLRRSGRLPEPWLGDETSIEAAAYYSRRAMDDPDSSYRRLAAYHDELSRIHDSLQRMEDNYRRTEGDDAARWGKRT